MEHKGQTYIPTGEKGTHVINVLVEKATIKYPSQHGS